MTKGQAGCAVGDFAEIAGVLGGVGEDCEVGKIFGGSPNHGGATDIDLFDRFGQSNIWFGNGFGEGIEVDYYEIDRPDILSG